MVNFKIVLLSHIFFFLSKNSHYFKIISIDSTVLFDRTFLYIVYYVCIINNQFNYNNLISPLKTSAYHI